MTTVPTPEHMAKRLRELAPHEQDPEVRQQLLADAAYLETPGAEVSGFFRKCACVCGCTEEQAPRSWTCVPCRTSECSRPAETKP